MTNASKKERPVTSGPTLKFNDGANIDDFEFSYLAEKEKLEFVANINSLFELYNELYKRVSSAQEHNKPNIFFTVGELQVFNTWLFDTIANIQRSYEVIDHTNRITNKLYRASIKIREYKKVVHLKDVL